MLKFSALSRKSQTSFFSQLIGLLEKSKKQHRRYIGFVSFLAARINQPRLMLAGNRLAFEFDCPGLYGDEQAETRLEFYPFSDSNDLQNIQSIQSSKLPIQLATSCTCRVEIASSEICEHALAAIEYLHKILSKQSTDKALAWLQECYVDSEMIGQRLVEDIRRLLDVAADTEEYRLHWRLASCESEHVLGGPVDCVCYLQKKKQRSSGWTCGRRIRNILATVPSCAFRHPRDRSLALVLENMHSQYGMAEGCEVLQLLELLQDYPDLCWDVEGLPKAIVERKQLQVELVEIGGSFFPQLVVDGDALDTSLNLMPVGKDSFLGVIAEVDSPSVLYFTLSLEQARCVQHIQKAHGARSQAEQEFS